MSSEKTAKAGHKPPQTETMPASEIENLISNLEGIMRDFIVVAQRT